jgi:YD repeat-containing protein
MKKWGSSAVIYSSTGNMTGFSTRAMTYSQANRLATANPFGTTSTYWYDAFGQKLKVKVATQTPYAVNIYDLWGNLLTETNLGVETDYVYLDTMPLSAIQPTAATISALHTDRIGMVQNASNATKTVVWTGNFDPFGLRVTASGSITESALSRHVFRCNGLLPQRLQGLFPRRICRVSRSRSGWIECRAFQQPV